MHLNIKVKLLTSNGKVPEKGTKLAAGYDLFAAEAAIVPRLGRKLIKTNISLEIPENYYGRIAPRSGLAFKKGIDVLAGVIDADYRGDIGVILFNTDEQENFEVKVGDKIAQIIFESCPDSTLVLASENESLSASDRGDKGYGHTG